MNTSLDNVLIKKEILHPGTNYTPLTSGTRVRFHYQTRRFDGNGSVIDDSKKTGKPMELVLGKKFKLDVWEVIVQKMALNEVAKFTVDQSLVLQYPFVAKTIRDAEKPHEDRRTHTCGMTLQNEGLGYPDLDDLLKAPCDLEFIIELISIEKPQDYQKDSWQMDDDEKLVMAKKMKEEGNSLYKQDQIKEAEYCYQYAIGLLEQLMLKEKPGDVEWTELADLKAPLLLNYAQCKLLKKEFYHAITHCTEVIKLDPNNPKAYYRRAKAYTSTWNLPDAEKDYAKCVELDPKLAGMVAKELAEFKKLLADCEKGDKDKFKNMF